MSDCEASTVTGLDTGLENVGPAAPAAMTSLLAFGSKGPGSAKKAPRPGLLL